MLMVFSSTAQQQYFIYIQSESQKTFTVSVNGKTYNASNGYVIIPQLYNGFHKLSLQIPGKPLLAYQVRIDKKDVGLSLEEKDNTYSLVSLQSKETVLPEENKEPVADKPTQKPTSAVVATDTEFAKMLNGKPKSAQQKTENAAVVNNVPIKETVKETVQSGKPDNVAKPLASKTIIKSNQKTTDAGTSLTFIDINTAGEDTISVFIPSSEELTSVKPKEVTEPVATKKTQDIEKKPAEQPIKPAPAVAATDSVTNPFKTTPPEPVKIQNTDCKLLATEEDFFAVRKKMSATNTQDKMLDAAEKYFKGKCFSAQQIKQLGHMFLNDQSRVSFFGMAYKYVADPANYIMLESQIFDPKFKEQFRQILRK